jgi:hypothetical protein
MAGDTRQGEFGELAVDALMCRRPQRSLCKVPLDSIHAGNSNWLDAWSPNEEACGTAIIEV